MRAAEGRPETYPEDPMMNLLRTLAAALALCAVLAASAAAELPANLAQRSDDDLAKLAAQLESRYMKRNELKDEPVVTLLCDDVVETGKTGYAFHRNVVLRVGDKGGDAVERRIEVPAGAGAADFGVWIARKQKIERPEGEFWSEETVDGARYVVFRVGDLKKKDQVGLSFTETQDRGFMALMLPGWDETPLMMRRLRVQATGDNAYRIEGWRLPRDGWSLKTIEEREGMPVDERLTLVDVTAPSAPGAWDDLPVLLISPRAGWNDMAKMWFEPTSWNEIAVGLSGMRAELEKKLPDYAAKAAAVVGGETDPAARMQLLHDWAQATYTVESPFARDRRDGELSTLLTADRARAGDLSMLVYAMARSLGVELEIFMARRSDLGYLKQGTPDMRQFTDIIMRLPGDQPLYYYPGDPACAAGQVPERLHGCEALLVRDGLMQEMMELQKEAMSAGGSTPEQVMTNIRNAIAQADFAVWEKLP